MPKIYIFEPTELYTTSKTGYSFIGWDQTKLFWPREMGRFLGQVGAYNFFLRAGFKVYIINQSNLCNLKFDDLLIIDVPLENDKGSIKLDELLSVNCRLLLSGNFLAVQTLFGISEAYQIKPSSPYNSFGVKHRENFTPLQPANWSVYGASKIGNNTSGKIFEIAGDRLSPSTALSMQKNDSFFTIISRKQMCEIIFVNGHIFSALQSWLQGQQDLTPWLSWNRRQHWLDDYVDLLIDKLSLNLDNMERIKGVPKTTICLRHDNDESIDSSFSKLEHKHKIQGTFALLNDYNLSSWKTIQKEYPDHEYAFHYTTIEQKYNFSKLMRLGLSYSPFKKILNEFLTGRKVLSKGKLIKQVMMAKQMQICTDTLHRHFSYIPYPEIIDEFHGVYENFPNVLATSSFFRGNFYRWGADELDGEISTNAPWPDSQFPFWMPFKIANAARNGVILSGWENTLLMEPESNFVKQVLKVQHKNLSHKFVMICYHPSNARKSIICAKGTLLWLEEIIKFTKTGGYAFSRYDNYIKILNRNNG